MGAAYGSPRTDAWLSDTRSSYGSHATGYAEKVRGLLDELPFLRRRLERRPGDHDLAMPLRPMAQRLDALGQGRPESAVCIRPPGPHSPT